MSKTIFKSYMDKMDGYKRYFTQKDVEQLKKYEMSIDDQINALKFDFLMLHCLCSKTG